MNAAHSITLSDCWAKTDDHGHTLGVLEHCLHVGAVGYNVFSSLTEPLVSLVPPGGVFLIAGHDIGKISPGFLLKSPAWRYHWQKSLGLSMPDAYESRHAWVSQAFLANGSSRPSLFLIAVGGHHGRYLCKQANPAVFGGKSIGEGVFQELRQELADALQKEFGSLPEDQPITKGARLHWFTGMMIFSDWIGSNTTWFPLENPSRTAEEARTTASQALDEIGWARHAVRSDSSFADLFELEAPNALQQTLHDAVDSPGLYVIEAPMGGGKTEAALFAAQRRWTEGSERGMYFALPTQLTSNRIHERIEGFLRRSVENWSSIALVHGNAWLMDNRIKPLLPSGIEEEDDPALPGNRWFSDSRRALLAPFGAGTIDQALMSVLPVKFSALRMFALGGKVVVIDEVHSYDAYTSAIVDRLVKWLLELHCTVIILSATLTTSRRKSLVEAAGATTDHSSQSYPLITKVSAGSNQAVGIEIPDAVPTEKIVHIEACADGSWMDKAANAAEAGACVLVIRNTVALAQETHRWLKEKCRDVDIEFGCIHSRFTQADRTANETRWMDLLGRESSRRPQNGAILVGTQVLEQSVDIDADLLITDTAPTDLILQRIGRLHRHPRSRPLCFEEPRCILLLPNVNWNANKKEIEEQLKPHRFVYPPFHLHMTEKIWGGKFTISIPSEIRTVLEESASIPTDLPTGAAVALAEYLDQVKKRTETALRLGPFSEAPLEDTEGSQTRWIEQQSAHLILLRANPVVSDGKITLQFDSGVEHTLTSGVFDFQLARLLHLYSIRLSRYLVLDVLQSQPDWLKQHFQGAALAVVNELNEIELWRGLEMPAYAFTYHKCTGLAHVRNAAAPKPDYDDDESWF